MAEGRSVRRFPVDSMGRAIRWNLKIHLESTRYRPVDKDLPKLRASYLHNKQAY